MADERDPDVSEDPRQKGTSEQMPEERHRQEGAGEGRQGAKGGGADAPGTSHPAEGGPGEGTGNPRAAGSE